MNLAEIYEDAIQNIKGVENTREFIRSTSNPRDIRLNLQRWISILRDHLDKYDDVKSEEGKPLVHILLNHRYKPIKDSKTYTSMIDTTKKELQEGNILLLFYVTHDDLHMRDADIVLQLTDQEYKELLPTPEEEEPFFLCGIRIIKDNLTQYGEYVTIV